MIDHPTGDEVVIVGWYQAPTRKEVAEAEDVPGEERVFEARVLDDVNANQTRATGHTEHAPISSVASTRLGVVTDQIKASNGVPEANNVLFPETNEEICRRIARMRKVLDPFARTYKTHLLRFERWKCGLEKTWLPNRRIVNHDEDVGVYVREGVYNLLALV